MDIVNLIIRLIVLALYLGGMWKMFQKMGKPDAWKGLIPIWNMWIIVEDTGVGVVWFILLFIPIANIFALAKIGKKVAPMFGKAESFGWLGILWPIFVAVLGFGSCQFVAGGQQVQPGEPAQPQAPAGEPQQPQG